MRFYLLLSNIIYFYNNIKPELQVRAYWYFRIRYIYINTLYAAHSSVLYDDRDKDEDNIKVCVCAKHDLGIYL